LKGSVTNVGSRGELPKPVGFDRDYWLCRCEGFAVRTPERRLGVVREVRYRSRLDRPDEIVLAAGLFGSSEDVVPVSDVDEIVPSEELIVLTSRRGAARRWSRLGLRGR
jgi:hypothetical protein